MKIKRWKTGSWDVTELNNLIDGIETSVNLVLKEKDKRIEFLEKQNLALIENLSKTPKTIIAYRGNR